MLRIDKVAGCNCLLVLLLTAAIVQLPLACGAQTAATYHARADQGFIESWLNKDHAVRAVPSRGRPSRRIAYLIAGSRIGARYDMLFPVGPDLVQVFKA